MEGLLRTAAIVVSAIVLVSFGLFAIDETRDASNRSVAAVEGLEATRSAEPTASEERSRERAHNSVREAIDDADDILVAPVAPVTASSSSSWVRRGIPTLLALLVYGFGLAFVARFMHGRV
jgi:hypothetical protein